jgi:hypothetical protein
LREIEEGNQWQVPDGCLALGSILAAQKPPVSRLVLTTNFDPLLRIAIRRARGFSHTTFLALDGDLENHQGDGTHLVHVHGYWTGSDHLHTPEQLEHERPRLSASIARVLDQSSLLVLGTAAGMTF